MDNDSGFNVRYDLNKQKMFNKILKFVLGMGSLVRNTAVPLAMYTKQ